jgi:16S rRNA (guanine527-N7)-methyltransferase
LAERYVQWLTGAGVERGLVGPRETQRIWERHVLNCAAVGALIEPARTVVDIGAGAGLPGIVLAIARPDLQVVLVESMLRRTTFLTEVVEDLGLSSVSVTRARAEELRSAGLQADVVTARAVAPIDKLAAWASPLLAERGVVLSLKGRGLAEEVAAGWPVLQRSRLSGEVSAWAVVASGSAAASVGAEPSELPGLRVVAQGRWEAAGARCRFEPAGDETVPDDERLALVVRLGRFPQGLSRAHPSGLG